MHDFERSTVAPKMLTGTGPRASRTFNSNHTSLRAVVLSASLNEPSDSCPHLLLSCRLIKRNRNAGSLATIRRKAHAWADIWEGFVEITDLEIDSKYFSLICTQNCDTRMTINLHWVGALFRLSTKMRPGFLGLPSQPNRTFSGLAGTTGHR